MSTQYLRPEFKDPSRVHIDEDCRDLDGFHEAELFYGCTFDNLNGLTLKDCDLSQSKFITEDLRKALNFTVTLNCLSFQNVTLSPMIFDLILCLLLKTKGNTQKRTKLIDILGTPRVHELLGAMKDLE